MQNRNDLPQRIVLVDRRDANEGFKTYPGLDLGHERPGVGNQRAVDRQRNGLAKVVEVDRSDVCAREGLANGTNRAAYGT
jgi:hypothetical protein